MDQMTFPELRDKLASLYTEGKYANALELVEQNAGHFPDETARITFWRMCLLSLAGRASDVISTFQQGLDSGLWWTEQLFTDPDLDAVRELPDFKRLAAVSQQKYEEARTRNERDQAILLPEAPSSGLYPMLITLHGRLANKEADLKQWEVARQRGWLVLSAQSTQALFPGAYCWDDPVQGLADLLFYREQISQNYPIDSQRILLAGFSQGSGLAIYTALKGSLPVRGFIGIGTWWADPSEFACEKEDIRGYFITGEKDHTLDRAREIQDTLRRNNIPFMEEVHPELGHEFPPHFEQSWDEAIKFILE